ncbi:MAG: hypothetical protein R3B67_02490 [Phycisphaerales bacterium]
MKNATNYADEEDEDDVEAHGAHGEFHGVDDVAVVLHGADDAAVDEAGDDEDDEDECDDGAEEWAVEVGAVCRGHVRVLHDAPGAGVVCPR